MTDTKPDNAMSGFERFNKNFLPYLLIAFGALQFIYLRDISRQDEQKKDDAEVRKEMLKKMDDVLLITPQNTLRIDRLETSLDKQETKVDRLEERQNTVEKTLILSNANR